MINLDKIKTEIERMLDDFVEGGCFSHDVKLDSTKSPTVLRNKILELVEKTIDEMVENEL